MYRFSLSIFLAMGMYNLALAFPENEDPTKTVVRKTADFTVNGLGDSPNWNKTEWIDITVQERGPNEQLATRAKILYSDLGIYFLFVNEDQKLSATLTEDFAALFNEDVVEVFLQPDASIPVYYEYELSPLDYELIILILNVDGKTRGWKPWHYEGNSRTQHSISVQGGERKSHASIKSWTAEFFIPFSLLQPSAGMPQPGTQWRANLYRIDYDEGYTTWTWQKTTPNKPGNFHEPDKFGTLVFE
ncbi:MAG TPA: carbohydrate-binding family 9-like protein [Cyclobacteriaceae bacterium]|nr:carbohydrate-binding family 9-like protein [Cyclobacteriaceae bacterium]